VFFCSAHCVSLVEEELHWVVVVCLERGEEYLVERMQALKLMKKFMAVAGEDNSS
jgi:Rapamycin-insensitive companion of mTOR, N-term